jgi:tRNA-dihydrouridine synthase
VREIATAELGQVSERALTAILEQSQADDRMTGRKYYSARYLFKIIKQLRARREKENGKVH